MWKFLKRALKTKQGRFMAGVVGGAILDGVARKTIGVSVSDIPLAGAILDSILGPEVSSGLVGLQLMRDQTLKDRYPELT